MGLMNWLYNTDPLVVKGESYHAGHDYWYNPVGMVSNSGEVVTPETAMRVSAVQASVRVLAESVAQLPLKVFRRLPNGGKEEMPNHPLSDLLHSQPNDWQTSFEWREMMQAHLALRGNAYSEIIAGRRGFADKLIPLHPDTVTVERLDTGRLRYEVNDPTDSRRGKRFLTQDEVFHLRGLSFNGIVGMSPIAMARESVGLSLATEAYGGRFFKNGASPSGSLEHPGTLSEEAQKNLRNSLIEKTAGVNSHSPLILEEGMKWNQIGMTSEDAQFLETRQYQVRDIARVFRIQPHMIGDLSDATYSNIEQQSLEFVIYTLTPWLVRWEQAISRDLILAPQTFFAKFNVDGLLRGDIKSRYEAHASALTAGWLTRNEVRKVEDKNPLPGLDEPLQQMNMTPPNGQPEPSSDDNNASNGNGHKPTKLEETMSHE